MRLIRTCCNISLLLGTACSQPSTAAPNTPTEANPVATVAAEKPPLPTRTYRLKTPARWTHTQAGQVDTWTAPEPEVKAHVIELTESDLDAASTKALRLVAPTTRLRERSRANAPANELFRAQRVVTMSDDSEENILQIIAMAHASIPDRMYVAVIEGPTKLLAKRGAELQQLMSSIEVDGVKEITFSPSQVTPLSDTTVEQLFSFVDRARARADVPGAALALVTPWGTWTRGFGAQGQGKNYAAAVSADTQFMIGSITKSFSTALMGILVDEGKFTWETPVQTVYPAFRLADEKRSAALEMRHLFCACVGAPRQDMEMIFEFADVKPMSIFDAVSRMILTTEVGETFQYNNQLTAAGGMIAGHVSEPRERDFSVAYGAALKARLLSPLGMTSTVLSQQAVQRRKNFARPHDVDLANHTHEVSLAAERFVDSVSPAGALWSTANDMAKYLGFQLARGKNAHGKRVISETNLVRTQTGQIAVSTDVQYGMGWIVGKTRGLQMVTHSGGTMGFNSDLVVFPEIGVGLFVVGNRSPSVLSSATRGRLLELLFQADIGAERKHAHTLSELQSLAEQGQKQLSADPIPDAWHGTYKNSLLGTVILRKAQVRSTFDAGEWQADAQMVAPGEMPNTFILSNGPLAGLKLTFTDTDGRRQLLLKASQSEYVFDRRQ